MAYECLTRLARCARFGGEPRVAAGTLQLQKSHNDSVNLVDRLAQIFQGDSSDNT